MKEWLLLTIEMDRLCNKKLEKNERKCQKEERIAPQLERASEQAQRNPIWKARLVVLVVARRASR